MKTGLFSFVDRALNCDLERAAVFTPPVTWHDCLALRITLQHIEPPVWRLIHAPAWLSLGELHEVIQLAFGWKNCHLHDFYSGDIRFGSGNEEEPELLVDERAAPLGAVAQVGGEILYTTSGTTGSTASSSRT